MANNTCDCKCTCENTAMEGKTYCKDCEEHYDYAWKA